MSEYNLNIAAGLVIGLVVGMTSGFVVATWIAYFGSQ